MPPIDVFFHRFPVSNILFGRVLRRAFILISLLVSGMAEAVTITVTATNGTIDGNGGACSISEATQNANSNAATNTDCIAGSGSDTIQLTTNVTLGASVDSTDGSNGTPSITTNITLDGQGYRIARNAALTCTL